MDKTGSLALSLADMSSAEVAIIGLAAFAVFFLGLGVVFWLAYRFDPVRRRLHGGTTYTAGVDVQQQHFLAELDRLGAFVAPKEGGEADKTRLRLQQAGFRTRRAVPLYYAIRFLSLVGLPLIAFAIAFFVFSLPLVKNLVITVLVVAIGFVGPSFLLDLRIRRRQKELRASLPDTLDLLVVCTEAGLGLESSLQRVAREMSVSHPMLSAELVQVNAEMLAGVDKVAALRNMAVRTGLEDIRGLVSLLAQSMRFGTSIAESLRVYADEFRDKRIQLAQEMAAKLPIKIIFPLALCFLPGFFIVALGPSVVGLLGVFQVLKQ